MNNLEFNKIFASLLIAGIIAMLCGFIAKQIVHPETLEKNAVLIEVAETDAAGGAAKPAGPEPILSLLSTADATRGAQVAKACAACHKFEKGTGNGVGPNLYNIINRKKDAIDGFAYSGELEKVGGPTWTYAELNHFLFKPKGYAPGTKMTYMGLKKTEDRAAVIAYLHTLSDAPAAMPSDAEIKAEAAELSPAPAEAPEGIVPPATTTPAADAKH